jgi:hypothetical protein
MKSRWSKEDEERLEMNGTCQLLDNADDNLLGQTPITNEKRSSIRCKYAAP